MRKAITAEGLSKLYHIGARSPQGGSLRESVAGALRHPAKWVRRDRPARREALWALKDVSFSVEQGSVVGVIGGNGAGKSTLLKILSRITEPTSGRLELYGRVGSLIEVGTGFHPDLTGRENVYLNGAILGMGRREIARKFDEIVAFSGVEKFINTPVKFYSSGMYMRLAFAVAAHLEPEVLVVDEVLAVGDASFQKKCLGKMDSISKHGRTVLFVSHNMAAITQLCQSVIWLESGVVREVGESRHIVPKYLQAGASTSGRVSWEEGAEPPPGDERARLLSASIKNLEGDCVAAVERTRPYQVCLEYEVLKEVPDLRVAFQVFSSDGLIVITAPDAGAGVGVGAHAVRRPGRYVSVCEMPGEFLNSGVYTIRVGIDIIGHDIICLVENALQLEVVDTEGVSGTFHRHPGVVYRPLPWRVLELS